MKGSYGLSVGVTDDERRAKMNALAAARMRRYRVRHRDRAHAQDKKNGAAYRERYPERSREVRRKWRQKNPERIREHEAKRRALKLSALVEDVDIRTVFDRDGYVCRICGGETKGAWPAPLSPTLDHIVPLSKGGEHSYANTQCAHARCNLVKAAT